ncbi:CheD [Thermaerobacter marianensis DSM 12885]|uniref:Probable chemoreceptor glutamine deamidase CheD n=1 Tax=Thermaerobacter marianensis (strain ATCC 700841 / DSM 12885 / JCM 10246 / 7p75a) TaxID=644966 RepID=E6SIG0_THEM7|nr:CheD [Thermaerobacter marianensis DSM 12885]
MFTPAPKNLPPPVGNHAAVAPVPNSPSGRTFVPRSADRSGVHSGTRVYTVGLGEAVVGGVDDILVVAGLGSCIALALWSRRLRIGALCHIVLPESCNQPVNPTQPAWYADWAVQWAVVALSQFGAGPPELVAKGAGGARVLTAPMLSDIGNCNVQAVFSALRDAGIAVGAFDVGGTESRTVRFFPATGALEVCVTRGHVQVL